MSDPILHIDPEWQKDGRLKLRVLLGDHAVHVDTIKAESDRSRRVFLKRLNQKAPQVNIEQVEAFLIGIATKGPLIFYERRQKTLELNSLLPKKNLKYSRIKLACFH